ncbi:MAG TPA: TIGR03067 domain-containing protein [Verrucomicrobiae bacterium]|nr:TIGR03067 domain-containing protein [Verrucomicrobiae bacterium]
MKTIGNALLVIVAAFTFAGAQPEESQAVKDDMARLQGEWSMESGVADGYPIPASMLPNSRRMCKGDEITATVGEQLVMKAKITIDPSRKPKTIDYQVIDGPTKGKKHLGIYELDGDRFKSCFGAPDAERPTDFTSKPGDRRTSSVWKREKQSAPAPEQK